MSANPRDLCENPEFRKAVQEGMDAAAEEARLLGFERVKKVHLEPEPFSVENGLLTPTFKLKRNVAREHYRDRFDAMYRELGE